MKAAARCPVTDLVDVLHHGIARTGHDVHVDDDVRRVRDFDAVLGDRVADRAHRERDDVHRAALHAALVRLLHLLLHLDGIHPVVRRTRVDLLLGADERAALDTGHVGFMRAGEVALRTLLRFRQKDLLL